MAFALFAILVVVSPSHAQPLDESCTVNILNRSVQVAPNGTFALANVPEEPGFFRVRAVCERPDGRLVRGQSEFIQLTAVPTAAVDELVLGAFDSPPAELEIQAPRTLFTFEGQSAQFTATAILPGDQARNATAASAGTLWASSDPEIVSVDSDGLVTAHARGRAIVMARNEGVVASMAVESRIPNDADGDGLPDDFEEANGLNPNDAGDAAEDRDGDGLSNLREFELGTAVGAADSDGDGLADGEEIALGSDPVAADSDGDGLLDGTEVLVGTDLGNPDTDGDGLQDGLEVDFGIDPLATNPTTTVTGRVVGPDGAAVPGATALVFGVFTAVTDAAGELTIPRVPADQGDLVVSARSIVAGQVFDGESPPVPPVAGGATDVGAIQLEPVIGRVTGTVLSPRGEPVGNARVTVTSGADFRSTNSDASGQYQVDGLPPGDLEAAAVDPSTGLRGRATGTLLEGQSSVLDVRLTAAGTITGPVLGRDGVSSVGRGVTASLSGPASRSTSTDFAGEYRFGFVPLGVYRVEAADADGNRGRTAATVTRTSEVVSADVTYLGRGRVTGTVETASGFPVSDATVDLASESVFGGRFTATTGAVGEFTIDGVFVGDFTVSAQDPSSGLGGYTDDSIDFDGQQVRLTVTLTPAGTLTGTVFEADGSTPAPGSVVTLQPSRRQATADASGVYRFEDLPLGSYTLDVTSPGGDRARATAELSVVDEVVDTDLVLNGLGTVDVTVLDAGGTPVQDAQVLLASDTVFGGTRQAITDSAGRAGFADVLAGPISVSAMDPFEELGGSIESNLLVGEDLDVTVSLEAAGAIMGTVLAADGSTPVPNIRVRVGPVRRDVTTAADGGFRFDMLPVARSPYTLEAFDANGASRARVSGLDLVGHGDEVTADLVLTGTGTVTGVVVDDAGVPASGVGITLDSDVSGLRDLFAVTDSSGIYTISRVPEGSFRIFAVRSEDRLAGSAVGAVTADGEVVTVDVQLERDRIPPSSGTVARLFDAHNFEFGVQQDGSVRDGTTTVFRGDGGFNRGAFLLSAEGETATEPFGGSGGTFELGGRQVVLPGVDPTASGLEIERKVYVPERGYFARYLEIVRNPTAAPVQVDLRLDSHFRFIQITRDGFRFDEPPRIVDSSSGDADLAAGGATPDRWVMVDDNLDADPVRTTNLPSVAHVFDGAGAPVAATEADFAVDFAARFGRLETAWRGLEVPPGETVIVMHFAVQETGRAAARAAAQRLAQLPPEALTGLTPAELTGIVNFDVPADGLSALEPLAPLDGAVSGTVIEGDGTTLVPAATVRFRSDNPIFSRVFSTRTDDEGDYAFASRFNTSGSSIAVPREGFVVEATHPGTGVISSPSSGTFTTGSSTAERNIIFAATGVVTGTVRRPDGTVASAGTVRLTGDALLGALTTTIAVDGRFGFTGLPEGTYSLLATTPTGVTGSTSAAVTAGEETVADITLVPTGTAAGQVLNGAGAPAVDVRVELTGPGDLSRTVRTDTAGEYVFPDLPLATYTVRAVEPETGLPSEGQVQILEDTTSRLDLDLIAVGSVAVEATFSDGSVAQQAAVQIRRSALGDFFVGTGTTDFLGRRTIDSVPAGDFTVRVFNPSNPLALGEESGEIVTHGETVTVPIVVPVDQPPAVELTAPPAGTVIVEGIPVTLEAAATDDLGVSRVEFLADGEVVASDSAAPYSVTVVLSSPAAGDERALVAAAFDNGGNRSESAPVLVEVTEDAEPPTVAVTSPAGGSSFIEGTSIGVQATAADNVAVDRVELSAGGAVFATDAAAPYGATFQIPGDFADAGPTALELRATAFDRAGLSAGDAVSVTVVPDQPPTITLTDAPADGSTVIEGTRVTFAATATDDIGVEVDLLVDGELRQTRSRAPFTFLLEAPPVETVDNPVVVELVARDTQGQTTAAPPVSLEVIADEPPEATLTAPAAGVEIVEGSLLTLSADATDDRGVDRVEFFVDGVAVGVDRFAPYSAETRLSSGSDLSTVPIRAVAFDTAEQPGESTVEIVRRDDTVPPTVAIAAPSEGSIFSVGPSDVAIVIDTSGSTGSSCGADVDGDGFTDNILECEVAAAKELLDFLDPEDTQVAVIDFSSSAILVRALTTDFALAEQALDNIRAAGPGGGTNFGAAMQRATNELAGTRARRSATPIQLFFSDGSASYPSFEVDRASEGGVIANTFAVGTGANPTVLERIADGTGGVFTSVVDPGDLVDILPRIIQFGIDALAVVTDATDNAGVREVEIRVTAADGSIDETAVDETAPFNAVFSLPALSEPLDLSVTVTARDFGDNEASAGPTSVTALPAVNDPEIVRLDPTLGTPGQTLRIFGKFFDPDPAGNTVLFNGEPTSVDSGDKILLRVTVPSDATEGPLVVEADGISSNAVDFGIDSDGDGLSDGDEAALGTDPLDPDTDDDGLSDGEEVDVRGTDPLVADTDGDGLDDGVEVANGLDPLDGTDAAADPDGDGLSNAEEIALGTNRLRADTDGDGLGDGDEVDVHGTDPLVQDTDGGGRSDGSEVIVDGTDPLDPSDDLPVVPLSTTLFDAEGFLWDVQRDGRIGNGTIDAYDGGLRLRVDGSSFGFFSEALTEDGGRELAIGPYSVGTLRVVRKIFVPTDGVFARFLEIVENPSTTEVTARVSLFTNLGSDGGTDLVATSSGDQVFDTVDDYLITDDADATGDPTMVHVFSGPRALLEPAQVTTSAPGNDDIRYDFDVTVPAGGRAIVMHYASQNASQADALPRAEALRDLEGSALDGLSRAEQEAIVNFSAFPDADGDGLSDEEELALGTDPADPDTDGDGMLDGFEVAFGFDPLDPTDAALDADGDGLANVDEQTAGTDPLEPDTDGDGLSDGDEVSTHGTDPLAPDTDDDGLLDGDEVGVHGTDPLDADTDGDGFNDGTEVDTGSDPLDPVSRPAVVLYGAAHSRGGPADFYRVDSTSGAATLVGPIGFNRVSAMDADDQGRLLATGEDPATGQHVLTMVDQATGAATLVGPTGVESLGFGDTVAGMSFRSSDGLLYAYLESGDGLGVIDPQTGAATALGPTLSDGCCGNGTAFSSTETLFHATEGPLATLDPVTGLATTLTSLVFSPPADSFPRVNAMDFLPGTDMLFASLNDGSGGSPENYLATIDTATGIVSIIGPTADGLDALAWVVRTDTDDDGLTDAEEDALGTDPADPDTDGGGRTDGEEVILDGTDPLDPSDDLQG